MPSSSATASPSGVARARISSAPRALAPPRRASARPAAPAAPRLGLVQHPRQVAPSNDGNRSAACSTVHRSVGMPSSRSTRSDSASHPSSRVREPAHAGLGQQLRAGLGLELAPQRPRPPRHRRVVGVGPCAQRINRVSPPEVARRSPGSNWSTSTTSSPRPASHHANDAPNVPAPTITTRSTPGTLQRIRGGCWSPPRSRRSCSGTPCRGARSARPAWGRRARP